MGWPVYFRCTKYLPHVVECSGLVKWVQRGIYCYLSSQVNEMSARLGKDFTVTPSKLVQFDPGIKQCTD